MPYTMRNQTFLAALAAMALGACVGGIQGMPGGDDTGGSARALFDNNVAPKLTAKCASCHVGPEISSTNMFLGPDGLSSYYDTLVNDRAVNGGFDPTAAALLTKGLHEGPEWTEPEKQVITEWLLAEQAERGVDTSTPTGPSNTSARGASMAFAACLSVSLTEYQTTEAYQVANMQSDRGRCYSCHEPGGSGGAYWGRANNYEDMLGKW